MLIVLAISFHKQLTRPHLHYVLRRLTGGREDTTTTLLVFKEIILKLRLKDLEDRR